MKYICELCKEEYESHPEWTLEEKMKEAKENGFGADFMKGECVTVCTPCYNKIARHYGFKEFHG